MVARQRGRALVSAVRIVSTFGALIEDQFGIEMSCDVAHFQCMGHDPGALHVNMTSLMSTTLMDEERR